VVNRLAPRNTSRCGKVWWLTPMSRSVLGDAHEKQLLVSRRLVGVPPVTLPRCGLTSSYHVASACGSNLVIPLPSPGVRPARPASPARVRRGLTVRCGHLRRPSTAWAT
jgi:hypothetical protein